MTHDKNQFAYDARHIVIADGEEILAYDGESEAPLWRHAGPEPIDFVALGEGLVLALGRQGSLHRFTRDGQARGTEALDGEARGLTAAAALTSKALHWLSPTGSLRGTAAVAGGQCLAAGGGFAAVGTDSGELWVFRDGADSPTSKAACGGAIHSVAWHPQRFWLVAVGTKVFRVDEAGAVSHFTSAGEHRPRFLCCSADGKHIGLALDDTTALVMEYPSKDTAGNATYGDRVITGLALGPSPWFGVGLDKGDGNKFNLETGATHRTDTHPGRPHNRWILMAGFGKPQPEQEKAPPAAMAPPASASRAPLYFVGAVVVAVVLFFILR